VHGKSTGNVPVKKSNRDTCCEEINCTKRQARSGGCPDESNTDAHASGEMEMNMKTLEQKRSEQEEVFADFCVMAMKLAVIACIVVIGIRHWS
jgi:hypothetical protein